MGKWIEVCRCEECGKIYKSSIPYICVKCGANIGVPSGYFTRALGGGNVTLTNRCKKVVAKKGLFGWKVRAEEAHKE